MGEVRNAQQKTYRVEDVGLSAAVQSCNGVEQRVKTTDLRPLSVRLEALDNDRFDVHLQAEPGEAADFFRGEIRGV